MKILDIKNVRDPYHKLALSVYLEAVRSARAYTRTRPDLRFACDRADAILDARWWLVNEGYEWLNLLAFYFKRPSVSVGEYEEFINTQAALWAQDTDGKHEIAKKVFNPPLWAKGAERHENWAEQVGIKRYERGNGGV